MTVEAIAHFFSDGVYAKQMHLPKNHIADSHKHNYDHLSILAKGEVDIDFGGVTERFTAPCCINILAGIEHKITAIKSSVFYCIHATNEKDNIDEVLIMKESK